MNKPKSEIVKVIEGALSGGADAVYDALVQGGCIESSETDEPPEMDEPGAEPTDDVPSGGGPDPFAIGEKDDAKSARGKAAGFAFSQLGKR